MENKYLQQALEYIKSTRLSELPAGKYIINDDNVWMNIIEAELRPVSNALLETHDVFLDIHIPIDACESYGVKDRVDCRAPRGLTDKENDILFYDDEIRQVITKKPGEMMVFDTDMAHAPLIGTGRLRKAIFKVRKI